MTGLTPDERERRIRETPLATGATRAEAAFIRAREAGEIGGVVIVVGTGHKPLEK
jgi:hypothetical protein